MRNSTIGINISIGVMMVGVVLLSFFSLSHQSLRLDEAQSLYQTSHTPGKLLSIVAQDVHVPLYHLLLHTWQIFFGNGVATDRILSLLFFALTIPVVYATGKRFLGVGEGLFAAGLVTLSPFLNWYGNELRMYSLLTLLTAASQYLFLRARQTGGTPYWIFYAFVALLGIFTHYFFWLVLLTQGLFYLVYARDFPKRSFPKILSVFLFLGAAFGPWLLFVYHLGLASTTQPLLTKPTSVNLFGTYAQFLFGFQDDHLNTIIVSFWPIIVLLGFIALQRERKVPIEARYAFLSAFLPIILIFAVSVALKPVFLSRYLIIAVPGLYLFLAWLTSIYPPRISWLVRTFLLVSMASGLYIQLTNKNIPVKENYQQAAQYLNNHATDQDIIIVSAPFTVYPLEYYYTGSASIQTLPIWNRFQPGGIPPFVEKNLPAETATLKGTHQTAWLLLSYDQGYQDVVRAYFDTHFQQLSKQDLSPGLTLYSYKLRYDPQIYTFQ